MIKLYSNDCPKCKILKRKLDEAGVECEVVSDVDRMVEMGLTTVPMLEVDEKMMDFMGALNWIKEEGTE